MDFCIQLVGRFKVYMDCYILLYLYAVNKSVHELHQSRVYLQLRSIDQYATMHAELAWLSSEEI
jgi:hypothetical protein